MPAVYCFTEIDQIADFKIFDESKSASQPVAIGKTKKTVIEGVKTRGAQTDVRPYNFFVPYKKKVVRPYIRFRTSGEDGWLSSRISCQY